ncbi:MAG: serine hydrolase [Microbacterium sp.]
MNRADLLLDRLVREADATGFSAHGMHVLVGDDVAEHRWTADLREEIQSVAKGVCVIAAAMAVDEGFITFDDPIASLLPEFELGSGVDQVTMRHLLTMTSGIDLPWSPTLMADWPDLAREFLRRPSAGRAFQYSDASTYTAMTALAERVGDVLEFVRPRLFEPLGLGDLDWRRCPNERILGGSGIALRTEELARLGRLIRDRGRWQGRQLVSPEWIDAMHSSWVETGDSPGYDRYALAGWAGPGSAWRLHGAGGQLLLFSGSAVITITADDHFGADAMAAFAVDAAAEAI